MYYYNLLIFLLYLLNNLYELSARKTGLQIIDPSGQLYTNGTYYYRNEETVVVTCNLTIIRSKFNFFWTSSDSDDHHDHPNEVATSDASSTYPVDLTRGDHKHDRTVFCHANEVPAGDGTTNITAYVQFIKTDTATSQTNRNQTVPSPTALSSTALEWHKILYWTIGAGTFVTIFVVALMKCVCKKSPERRLVEFQLATGVSEVVAAKVAQVQPHVAQARPHLAPTYAAPRDHVRGNVAEKTNNYIEPFRETDVNKMYSIPVPKNERKALKKEMEHDDDGSYEYVVQAKRAGYDNLARNGNVPYVNVLK